MDLANLLIEGENKKDTIIHNQPRENSKSFLSVIQSTININDQKTINDKVNIYKA